MAARPTAWRHERRTHRRAATRAAGGLFIYAISIMDAYKLARLRWERYRAGAASGR